MLTYYTAALTTQVSTYTAKLAAALTTAAIAAGITSVSQLRGMNVAAHGEGGERAGGSVGNCGA